MAITIDDIEALTDGLAKVVKEELAKRDARIEQLEARPEVKYCGVHEERKGYVPGSLVTRSGSLWLCTAPTDGQPGDPYVGSWKLIVKSGRA